MAKRIRLVFLGHVARFSGAEIEMLRVVEAARDVESIVLLAEDGPLVPALADAGARVEVMPLRERTRNMRRTEIRPGASQARAAVDVLDYVVRLRRRLIELSPDVVSAVSLKAGTYGAPAARLARIPMVWHLHDQIASNYLAREAVLPMRTIVATLPSAVIAPSQATLDVVGWFRPGMRTAVIPHPIPIPAESISIQPRVTRVGILGRLAPWKGQHVFLQAFAKAFPQSDVRAVVIGTAMFDEEFYANDLHQLASELGIADRVDFLGFRRDVEAELRQLDLLVHASVTMEPFGTAVFEGMALGLPVIVAAAGGPGEYVVHESTGLLHRPGDVEELAATLSRMAGDHALRVRLGAAGRERVREFAPEAIVQAWLEVYADVLGREEPGLPEVAASTS